MASSINDINVDEMFFDANYIEINPTHLSNHFKINNDQLSILNINIQSLTKNFNMLLSLLNLSKIHYTIIVVSETWLKDSDDSLFNITGYNHISLNRRGPISGGGLRIYYSQSIAFIKINDALTGEFSSHECLACELSVQNKYKLKIIGIYRPPKNNMKNFIDHLKSKKVAHNTKNPNDIKIIAGDMNIDYKNNFNMPRTHQKYFDLFTSNAFKFHITKPTRLGSKGQSSSIIDHIWSNCFSETFSFTMNYKISDHIPNAVIFDRKIKVAPLKKTFFDFRLKNVINFIRNKHLSFDPLIKYKINEINEATDYIYKQIMKMLAFYFPIQTKQLTRKRLKERD